MRDGLPKTRSINELFRVGGSRLGGLKDEVQARGALLAKVQAVLPAPLSRAVVIAGLDQGQLTLGIAGAVWAARLRYVTETVRTRLKSSAGLDVRKVRIRVVPPEP